MTYAMVFNTQKFCVHDGPGIRTTVFLKGCPLNCIWCHNPESQSYEKEMMFSRDKCTNCGICGIKCSNDAIMTTETGLENNKEKCTLCGGCMDFCVNNAREIAGKEYKANELIKIIEKDRTFYEQSGGGVTFSGGEAMAQIDALEEIVKRCKESGISVAVDTCGYAPFSSFERILDYVDLFLYDIKLMDTDLHKKYTGKGNELIMENLVKLSERGANINLRLPLIQGINTDDKNIQSIIDFVKPLRISAVNLLPYHDIARDKYSKLSRDYKQEAMEKPSQERLEEIKKLFENNNFKVKIGG